MWFLAIFLGKCLWKFFACFDIVLLLSSPKCLLYILHSSTFFRYKICKNVLSLCGLSFHFLNVITCGTKIFNFVVIQFTNICILSKFWCQHKFLFYMGKYLGVGWLGYIVSVCLYYPAKLFQKCVHNFTFPLARLRV